MSAFSRLSTKALSTLPKAVAKRGIATAAHKPMMPAFRPPVLGGKRMVQLGAIGIGLGAAQYYLGSAENVFEHKFVTFKKPEDLADFYGTEDFMEIFCVLPFMVNFMMRNAEFDDDGTINAWGLLGPGELKIKIDFDENEIDTNGDGNPDTLAWFNKKESFKDFAPAFLGGFTLWEITQNFGYHLKDDGSCEVYHHGESFRGFFPMRLIFQLHSQYVIWATEKYINGEEFGMDDRDTELEEQRQNVPLHVFKHFIENLTLEVEKAKDSGSDSKKNNELEVTLQRLKTISSASNETNKNALPRLLTLRSRKTNVTRAHLIIDDEETKDTIKTAMEQISSSNGKKHEPVAELSKLARHTTISTRRKSLSPKE